MFGYSERQNKWDKLAKKWSYVREGSLSQKNYIESGYFVYLYFFIIYFIFVIFF